MSVKFSHKCLNASLLLNFTHLHYLMPKRVLHASSHCCNENIEGKFLISQHILSMKDTFVNVSAVKWKGCHFNSIKALH